LATGRDKLDYSRQQLAVLAGETEPAALPQINWRRICARAFLFLCGATAAPGKLREQCPYAECPGSNPVA
jgi:hypothetical protein